MANYAEKLKDPRWQKKRLRIFERDNFTCKKCTDKTTTLCVHHKKYNPNTDPWDYNDNDLDTLCDDCHEIVELFKKSYEYEGLYISKSITSDRTKFIVATFQENCHIIIKEDTKSLVHFDIGYNSLSLIIKSLKRAIPKNKK